MVRGRGDGSYHPMKSKVHFDVRHRHSVRRPLLMLYVGTLPTHVRTVYLPLPISLWTWCLVSFVGRTQRRSLVSTRSRTFHL